MNVRATAAMAAIAAAGMMDRGPDVYRVNVGSSRREFDDMFVGMDWGREPSRRLPKCTDPKKKAKRKMQAASRRRNRQR